MKDKTKAAPRHIYLLTIGNDTKLVAATSLQVAVNHLARQMIKAKRASQFELVEMIGSGCKIETASATSNAQK